jgi:magnesium transporter
MSQFTRRFPRNAVAPPGTLVHIGEKMLEKPKITVITYDARKSERKEVKTAEECFRKKGGKRKIWVNIDGLHDTDLITKIGSHYGIHPLVLEDIVNTTQRPKFEDFEDYIYAVVKALHYEEKKQEIWIEQVSIIFGKDYIISFQEEPGDVFDPIRESIRKCSGRTSKSGPDYLSYRLMDALVDDYFVMIEKIGGKIEEMEESLINAPTMEMVHMMHHLKREMLFMRKAVWPLREVVGGFERSESTLIDKKTSPFIRDLHDHTAQVIDTIETFREMTTSMTDLYLTSMNNKMNQVMKVLTIIATIFMPLSFFASVYGMNFDTTVPYNMPELHAPYGYPVFILSMLVLSLIMLYWFRWKKWL